MQTNIYRTLAKKGVLMNGKNPDFQVDIFRNMRDDLRSNPDQFLVNLILMSVQFLKSHDRQSLIHGIVRQDVDVDEDVEVGVGVDVDEDVDADVDIDVEY